MKKLGVVIPIYNTERFLCECIESVLAQEYRDFLLVLVDDGSTDRSGEICDKYLSYDERVRVIHQDNQGMLKARQIGLHSIECEYLTTIDSDDFIMKETFEKAKKYMNEGIDIISYGIVRYRKNHNSSYILEEYAPGLYFEDEIKHNIIPEMIWDIEEDRFVLDPSLCNKIVKRDLLLKFVDRAADTRIDYGQDVAVSYPMMSEARSIQFIGEFLYYHRQRSKGELPGYMVDEKFYEKTFLLYEYLTDFFKDSDKLKKQIELFYVYSLELRLKQLYGKTRKTYVFPFSNICKGKKIVLYGAGMVGRSYFSQIKKTNNCEIVVWVDKEYNSESSEFKICSPSVIRSKCFDYVVIATIKNDFAEEIKNYLSTIGIDKEKILM